MRSVLLALLLVACAPIPTTPPRTPAPIPPAPARASYTVPTLAAMPASPTPTAPMPSPALEIERRRQEAAETAAAMTQATLRTHEEAEAEEARCAADPACQGPRLVTTLCHLRATTAELEDAIRRERANPAGVVNLVTLHDLGDTLRQHREEMLTRKAEYKSLTHREWTPRDCS